MTLVVPFDGSNLSKAALVRARQFDSVLGEGVLVVSVVPKDNAEYARERGWIGDDDPFDARAVVSRLRDLVAELAPDADFHHHFVDRYARRGTIATRIRRFARDHDATIVFVGSENAGRIAHSITVGQSVASERSYDTMLITQERLPRVEKLEENVPTEDLL